MTLTIVNETTGNNGFQIQTTDFDGLRIESVRSPRAPSGAEFLPARVIFDGKEVWSFSKNHKSQGFLGLALLREVDDELIIAIVTRNTLCEVLPVRDLPHLQRVGGELIGGRKLSALIELKELIAQAEGLEPIWSKRENSLREAMNKTDALARQAATQRARREAAAEQQREQEARRAERRAQQDARRAEIISRQRVFAQTLSGDRRHGHPVVGDEWTVLGDGAFCISVTSYSQKGEIGELIESFMVKKNGMKKVRWSVTAVAKIEHQVTPVTRGTSGTRQVDSLGASFVTVPVKGVPEEVILVANMDAVRALRDQGLNSGTLAMCPKAGDESRFSVFSISAGKIEPVTEVVRK